MLASSISILLPVFFVIALGYWAGRSRQFDLDQVKGVNNLVVEFTLPALMFVGIVAMTADALLAQASFLFVLFLGFAGAYLLTLLVSVALLRRSLGEAALQASSVSFPSVAFMGFPIFDGLFGRASFEPVSSANAIGVLVIIPATVVLLEIDALRSSRGPAGSARPRTSLARIAAVALFRSFKKPIVWVPLLSFGLIFLDIRVPNEFVSMAKLIGQTTSGVALFAAGLVVAAYRLTLTAEVIGNVVAKMVIQPLGVAVLALALALPQSLTQQSILMFALPTAAFAALLAPHYGRYESESASTLILTTLAMVGLVPLIIFIIGQ
jgi:malonate transporter